MHVNVFFVFFNLFVPVKITQVNVGNNLHRIASSLQFKSLSILLKYRYEKLNKLKTLHGRVFPIVEIYVVIQV